MGDGRRCDVHQHLWPAALIEALRARREPPYLRDWTLYTSGEAPYQVEPADHDPAVRAALDPDTTVLVSLSSPLGIECLPPREAEPLLDAWHQGVLGLPAPFVGWAALAEQDADPAQLDALFEQGLIGLQVSAGAMTTPRAVEQLAPVLDRCEQLGRPVFVHPGPAHPPDGTRDVAWWPAVVDYTAQLHAAWWAWRAVGRSLLPTLRICFAAGAGLAPLHHERFAARGGGRFAVDAATFVDTSSHGRQAVDALTRALGIDVIVLGSDRPYAEPVDLGVDLGEAARVAVTIANPARLVEGGGIR